MKAVIKNTDDKYRSEKEFLMKMICESFNFKLLSDIMYDYNSKATKQRAVHKGEKMLEIEKDLKEEFAKPKTRKSKKIRKNSK